MERVAVCTVRHGTDRCAHGPLGAREQLIPHLVEAPQLVFRHEALHTALHQLIGAGLSPDVAHGLVRGAHVGADELDERLVRLARADQLGEWDVQALLEQLARFDSAHATADVGHVRRGGREGHESVAVAHSVKDGPHKRHIAHVPCPLPGIVGDQDVARSHGVGTQLAPKVAHRGRQGANERRDTSRVLRQCVAPGVREHTREVIGLVRQRRKRRADNRLGRLVDDGDEARPEHLQRDGVEPGRHASRASGEGRDTVMMIFPLDATRAVASGPTTSVEPASSTIAGPANASPTARRSRS